MRTIPPITFFLLVTSVVSVFLLSGDVLTIFGYNFALEGGSFVFKVHPAFYLLFFSFASLLLYRGSMSLIKSIFISKTSFILLTLCIICFLYQVLALSQPMAPFIVTWLTPLLFVILYDFLDGKQIRLIGKVVLFLVILNSCVAIVEYVLGEPIVPRTYFSMEDNDLLDISEWEFSRAVSFYGHPLIATLATSVVVVGLYAKSNFESLSKSELCCLCIALIALPAFGGRASIAVSLLLLGIISLYKFKSVITGYGTTKFAFLFFSILIITMPLFLLLLLNLGLFDALLSRIDDDNGSAETRLTALYILFDTSFTELIFGDYNKQLFIKQLLYGTKYGIEIFWLAIVLQFGIVISGILVYLLFFITRKIQYSVGHFTLWSSLAFVLAISSGTGLASKTLSLSHFVLISLFLLYPKSCYQQSNS